MTVPPLPSGIKTCTQCGQDLPATDQYFDQDATKDDGLRTVCKQCRCAVREENELRKRDQRLQMVDDAAYNLLNNVARGGSDVPHVAEVYQRLMDVFDGAGGYATHFMAQYLEAKPGSTTRTKMLELLMRLGMKVSESGAAKIPVEMMNNVDLQNEVAEQARRIFRIEDGARKEDDHDDGTSSQVG